MRADRHRDGHSSQRAGAAWARVAAGAVCLLLGQDGRLNRSRGERAGGAGRGRRGLTTDLAVVLAVRYLVQAGALARGHGVGLRSRVGIETLHALSMGAAATTAPRYRRAALAGLAVATAVTAVDVTMALVERPST